MTVFVDDIPIKSGPRIRAFKLKARAGKDCQYQLYRESEGSAPDVLFHDVEIVTLKNGMRFYTVPPATFGSRI